MISNKKASKSYLNFQHVKTELQRSRRDLGARRDVDSTVQMGEDAN
jgi:hypothetical protein